MKPSEGSLVLAAKGRCKNDHRMDRHARMRRGSFGMVRFGWTGCVSPVQMTPHRVLIYSASKLRLSLDGMPAGRTFVAGCVPGVPGPTHSLTLHLSLRFHMMDHVFEQQRHEMFARPSVRDVWGPTRSPSVRSNLNPSPATDRVLVRIATVLRAGRPGISMSPGRARFGATRIEAACLRQTHRGERS
jgi:hypothetical protein